MERDTLVQQCVATDQAIERLPSGVRDVTAAPVNQVGVAWRPVPDRLGVEDPLRKPLLLAVDNDWFRRRLSAARETLWVRRGPRFDFRHVEDIVRASRELRRKHHLDGATRDDTRDRSRG